MANSVNFSTYGFLDDILALNEENWRRYFKPFVYDSVQSGLQVSAGGDMTINVSAGECHCGSVMGVLSSPVSLDAYVGDSTYPRIDSIIAQYTYDDPSTLVVSVLKGTAGENPVAPSLIKTYNSVWQMELAQIYVPANATTAVECTITDKRVVYTSLDEVFNAIDDVNSDINSITTAINSEILSITTDIDTIESNVLSATTNIADIYVSKADQSAIARVFSEEADYAVDDCVMYQGILYKFLSPHTHGPWVGGNEVTPTNVMAQGGGGSGGAGVGDEISFDDTNNAMIITSSGRSISSLESAVAIIATVSGNLDSHPQIYTGEYVYVKDHTGVTGLDDIPEGLYMATNNISANGVLDISTNVNLIAVSGGGLNSLLDRIPNVVISTLGSNTAGFHNSIFRGKDITSYLTDGSLWDRIKGTNGYSLFEDLFIGDYFNKNSVIWRICHFDYWLNTGDTYWNDKSGSSNPYTLNYSSTHHIVIMPDSNLLVADGSTTHWLNSSDTTSGGYQGTTFYTGTNNNGKATCRTAAQNAFGSAHILNHREYFTNSCMSGQNNVGYPTAGSWVDSDIDIPNERMIYGNAPFSPVSNGTSVPANYTIDKSQLQLFALAPQYITNRARWWLRDPVSASWFASVNYGGNCTYNSASHSLIGVRPAFGIY